MINYMSDQKDIKSHNEQHTKNDTHKEYEELGSAVKELMKPENLIEPFDSAEELMKKFVEFISMSFNENLPNQNNTNEKTEELGSAAKELMKPENIVGVFESTEEMIQYLLSEE